MTTRLPGGSIQLIAFDFDGVLTDNRVMVLENGHEAVFCNRSDGLAFDMFRAAGVPVVIVTTERNPVVRARAAKLQTAVLQTDGDKGGVLAEHCRSAGIDLKRVMFVGNDVNDLSAMRLVGFPVAVADAHPAVKKVAWRELAAKGGEGVAREVAESVLDLAYEARQVTDHGKN